MEDHKTNLKNISIKMDWFSLTELCNSTIVELADTFNRKYFAELANSEPDQEKLEEYDRQRNKFQNQQRSDIFSSKELMVANIKENLPVYWKN